MGGGEGAAPLPGRRAGAAAFSRCPGPRRHGAGTGRHLVPTSPRRGCPHQGPGQPSSPDPFWRLPSGRGRWDLTTRSCRKMETVGAGPRPACEVREDGLVRARPSHGAGSGAWPEPGWGEGTVIRPKGRREGPLSAVEQGPGPSSSSQSPNGTVLCTDTDAPGDSSLPGRQGLRQARPGPANEPPVALPLAIVVPGRRAACSVASAWTVEWGPGGRAEQRCRGPTPQRGGSKQPRLGPASSLSAAGRCFGEQVREWGAHAAHLGHCQNDGLG